MADTASGSVPYDVVLMGSYAKDEIVVAGECRRSLGGAVYFGSFALKALGLRAAVVTKLAAEDFGMLEEFRSAGIDFHARPGGATSGIRNIYTTPDMDRRTCVPMALTAPFGLEDVPEIETNVLHVAALVAGEIPFEVVQALKSRHTLGLDVQGFIRVARGGALVFEDWPEKVEGLAGLAYLKTDHAEAEVLTGTSDLEGAARRLASWGPREVVLTHADGVLVLAEGRIVRAPWTARTLAGRTGRGDTCMATYIGKRVKGSSAEVATRWAAALTSAKMEREGPFRGTLAEVKRHLDAQPGEWADRAPSLGCS